MKVHIRNIVIIGSIVLICLTVAITFAYMTGTDTNAPTYPTIDNAASVYENAVNTLKHTDNISLQITYKKETLLENEYITEQSVQTISYQDRNSNTIKAKTAEKLTIGTHTADIEEVFYKNQLYLNINGCLFRGNMATDAYLSRYTPAAPLSAALYNSVTGEDTGSGYNIYFSAPKQLEAWTAIDGAILRQANGTTHINAEGLLTRSIYTASYNVDEINFRISVTVEIDYNNIAPIQVPEQNNAYVELTSPDAPRILEVACGYLLDANGILATCNDEIICEAFGDRRNQKVTLRTNLDTAWSAQVDTEVELINSSKAGSGSSYTQQEIFKENTYSISIDGAHAIPNDHIDINAMRSYCRDLLVGTIILPQYITGAVITETENTYLIEFTGNDTFAQVIDAEACISLYQDGNVLKSTSQGYSVNTMNCSLEISKDTGLPLRSGLYYQGIYTIDELPYPLTYQTDHEYILLNEEAGA